MVSGIGDLILNTLGGFLYPLFSVMFVFIDGIQFVFKSFAGIETSGFNGQSITAENTGAENDTGIVYFLMNNELVHNMLMSIMLLALFLIVIFTVMAFLKNIYSAKPKGWKDIIGNAIKGLANFIFIPVCCLLGVWLGNILLNAINGATSSGGGAGMDRKLFIACAYNANEFRNSGDPNEIVSEDDDNYKDLMKLKDYTWTLRYYETGEEYNFDAIEKNQTRAYYANIVDDIYANTNISIYEWGTVALNYTLFNINYLVLIVGGIFMLYVLCSLAFAMVRRLILILVLFIISPGVCSLYPLDEGKALGSWKSEFIKQVLSAYGAVAGLNIFFSIVPLIDKIQIYGGYVPQMDEFIQLFVLVSGLLVVKELIALISGFVGGEDAYSKGSSLFASTRSAMKKYGGGAARKITGAFSTGVHNIKERGWGKGTVKNLTSSIFSMGSALSNAAIGVDLKKDIVDEWTGKGKAAKAQADSEKQAENIKEKLDPIAEKFQKATESLEKARENYEQIKNRGGPRDGQTKEAYEKEKWDAIRAMSTPSKAAQNASKQISSYLSSLPSDLLSWAEARVAKKSGVSASEFHTSIEAGKEAASLSSKYTAAAIDAKALVDALDLAEKGDTSAAKDLGLDLSDLSDKLGKGIKDLIKLFEGGVKFDLSDKSVIKNHGQYSADDARIAATAFNQALEKQQAKELKAEEAGKAFADHLLAQNGKFIDSQGKLVEYKSEDIEELKNALKSGNPADLDSTAIAKLIREETQANQNATLKQLAALKDIKKALDDLNKKS